MERNTISIQSCQSRDLIELGEANQANMSYNKERETKVLVIKTYTNPDEVIEVKNGDHFTTKFTGPINPA